MSGNGLTTIESSGSMSLLTDGTDYFLQPAGGAAVELSYGGAPVVAGQVGAWTPIAAAQTANGYEVAWKEPGADQYGVWYTDSSGNYLSSPIASAAGSSAQLESFETSFNYDLNGDGTIGVAPLAPPQFVYEGTDANGAQVYDVTNALGLEPFAVRVLTPQEPSTDYPHSFLYALPVEPGLTQPTFGSGLDELESLDVEDQYNATIIEPIFPIDSWYADNPNDPSIDYETFMATYLPEWVDSHFSTTGTEQNLLVGFSKSGYGAVDLLLKHPSVFAAAAAFDFPADMATYDQAGSSSADDYGTEANFENNYQLTGSFINSLKAPFTTEDRLLISEGPDYGTQVADFDALLTSQGVMHTLSTAQTNDAHSWSGGWLSGAVAGLYGLEQNLNSGKSA
jgi:Tryptophan-rich Synechocystis species C-terminal domain/Putative esterase